MTPTKQPEGGLLHLDGTFLTTEVTSRQVGSHRDVILAQYHSAILQQGEPGVTHWEETQRVQNVMLQVIFKPNTDFYKDAGSLAQCCYLASR